MDIFELDGAQLHELEAAHAYLQEVLGLPAHYGKNADALHDCLTEITGETIFWLTNADAIHPAIEKVFIDAMAHNPAVSVFFDENQ